MKASYCKLCTFVLHLAGAFELEDSRLRCEAALERLYLVAALAVLYATAQGMSVQIAGLRQQVDPHWRGISYLKIGLRWLKGVVHKGRNLLTPVPLLPEDPQPVFASKREGRDILRRNLVFSCPVINL